MIKYSREQQDFVMKSFQPVVHMIVSRLRDENKEFTQEAFNESLVLGTTITAQFIKSLLASIVSTLSRDETLPEDDLFTEFMKRTVECYDLMNQENTTQRTTVVGSFDEKS